MIYLLDPIVNKHVESRTKFLFPLFSEQMNGILDHEWRLQINCTVHHCLTSNTVENVTLSGELLLTKTVYLWTIIRFCLFSSYSKPIPYHFYRRDLCTLFNREIPLWYNIHRFYFISP